MEPRVGVATLLFYSGGIAGGLLLGWLFVPLWRLCAPRESNRRFWVSFGDVTRQMLTVDDVAQLLSLYRRLGREAGGYVLRNLGGLILASLPAAAFLILVAPAALALWDHGAERIAVYPPEAAQAIANSADRTASPASHPAGSKVEFDTDPSHELQRTAICWTAAHCTIFRLLAFYVIEKPEPVVDEASYVVIRAQRGRRNALWPYVNDLEFAFACAFMFATIASFWWRRTAA